MQAAHRGRAITSEAFDAVVEDLTATLEKLHQAGESATSWNARADEATGSPTA